VIRGGPAPRAERWRTREARGSRTAVITMFAIPIPPTRRATQRRNRAIGTHRAVGAYRGGATQMNSESVRTYM
jgi:hypothetical protein